ncbi:hypothetical protein QYS46_13305 [Klebsiella michiganensis]|nr:hypothetical protein [Klebsiella michiganensis]
MKIAPSKNRFNLSAWALENPQMVSFFMLLIMVIGSLSYTLLPRNEDPAFTIKTAVVSAQWYGRVGNGYHASGDGCPGEKITGNALARLYRK